MFYISTVSEEKLGVTDTSDMVEEFYTRGELESLVKSNNLLISGFTYTGSRFKVERKSLAIVKLESLENGAPFRINGVLYILVGENGVRDFIVYSSSNGIVKLKRGLLLNNNYSIDCNICSDVEVLCLYKEFVNRFPLSQLSYMLCNKYAIS